MPVDQIQSPSLGYLEALFGVELLYPPLRLLLMANAGIPIHVVIATKSLETNIGS